MTPQLFSNGIGRRQLGKYWMEARDGDMGAREFFDAHYSRKRYADGREPLLFVGPGFKKVLVTEDGTALWAWRKYKSDDGQVGVNCAIFRNEGPTLSSLLILDAEQIAWARWPGERLFTYVDPSKVKSANPGACFIAAGWKRCGITKVNKLLIFEKRPPAVITGSENDQLIRGALRQSVRPWLVIQIPSVAWWACLRTHEERESLRRHHAFYIWGVVRFCAESC